MTDIGGKIRAGYKAKGWTITQFEEALKEEVTKHPEAGKPAKASASAISHWCNLTPAMQKCIARVLDGDENFFAQ
jgi:hypothetical protein